MVYIEIITRMLKMLSLNSNLRRLPSYTTWRRRRRLYLIFFYPWSQMQMVFYNKEHDSVEEAAGREHGILIIAAFLHVSLISKQY